MPAAMSRNNKGDIVTMKLMSYYKLYDWIIKEFGFSNETGAYLLIYSFYENGKVCELSQTSFAEALKCTRMQAFRILKELEDAQYIVSERRSAKQTKVYRINEETLNQMRSRCNTDVTCNMDVTCNTDVTGTCNIDVTGTCNTDVTSTCNMDVTQKEKRKKRKEKEKGEREAAPARDFISIPNFPNVRLTKDEYNRLRYGFDLTATKKTLDAYFASIDVGVRQGKPYKDHFSLIQKWILHDGGKMRSDDEIRHEESMADAIAILEAPYSFVAGEELQ